MDVSIGGESLPFDWFILLLRVLFIVLIYFFLYQVVRVTIRELIAISQVSARPASPSLPNPSSRLEIVDPAQSSLAPGVSLAVGHHETIGRHHENSIVLDDAFVSSRHAEMSFERGIWTVRDLGSTNGTFLNGLAVRGAEHVSSGDTVQFGRMQLRFVA
jgi:FHA domain